MSVLIPGGIEPKTRGTIPDAEQAGREAGRFERPPLPLPLGEPVREDPEGPRMVSHPAVARGDLDALAPAARPCEAGSPGNDPVGPAEQRGHRDRGRRRGGRSVLDLGGSEDLVEARRNPTPRPGPERTRQGREAANPLGVAPRELVGVDPAEAPPHETDAPAGALGDRVQALRETPDQLRGRAEVQTEPPALSAVVEPCEKAADQARGEIAAEPTRKDEDRMPVPRRHPTEKKRPQGRR